MKHHERAAVERRVQELFAATPRPDDVSNVDWMTQLHDQALAEIRAAHDKDFAEFMAKKASDSAKKK